MNAFIRIYIQYQLLLMILFAGPSIFSVINLGLLDKNCKVSFEEYSISSIV